MPFNFNSIVYHLLSIIAVPPRWFCRLICATTPKLSSSTQSQRHTSPCVTLISPSSNRKALSDLSTVCFFSLPCVLIWPFWKDISTDVHSLNNKADHPPPQPHLTNNKPTVTGILYCLLTTWCEKHKAFGEKTRVLHLSEQLEFCYQLFGKLTLIILSDGFLSPAAKGSISAATSLPCSYFKLPLSPAHIVAQCDSAQWYCRTWCATDTKAVLCHFYFWQL